MVLPPISVIPAQAGFQEQTSTGHPPVDLKATIRFIRILGLAGVLICLLSPAVAGAGRIPGDLIQRTEQVRDAGLVVSAKPLMKRIERKEKLLLIDVRRAADFKALHIAGAIHVPLHFVKTKPYLKSSPVVLVERGLADHRLAPVCRELRTMGVDARLLDGGMNAWCHAGGPIVGDVVRQMAYNRISAADFFHEKDYARRIVCDVSAGLSEASRQLMPYAVHLPLTDNPALGAQIKSNAPDAILVVSEDGSGYAHADKVLARAGIHRVFYLDGGVNSYRRYLEGVAQSWRSRSERVVTHNQCAKCEGGE
jgi:rhodanese-related sulfurtransferase